MRVLYALSGGGNGHVSRAREVVPVLEQYAEVDVAISGTDAQVELPREPRFRHHGLIFHLGECGGIDYWKTLQDMQLPRLFRDISEFPIADYDMVINDFEPISARSARRGGIPVLALSHHASFYSKQTPRPPLRDFLAEALMLNYAPADERLGLHFDRYDDFIETPIIRQEVRTLAPWDDGHYTVYLGAYEDEYLMRLLGRIPDVIWHIFSKRASKEFARDNFTVRPISNSAYLKSLEGCRGLLTGGGFEGPSEALFLGKKLMMIPQKGQYEQLCNAEAARRLGVSVALSVSPATIPAIEQWVHTGQPVRRNYPHHTERLVQRVLAIMKPRMKRVVNI